MKTQHTPGPWIARSYPNAEGGLVCVKIWAGSEFSGNYVCGIASGDCSEHLTMAEGCANAQLIAEAPTMLAELTKLANILAGAMEAGQYDRPDGSPLFCEGDVIALESARAAIAKATEPIDKQSNVR